MYSKTVVVKKKTGLHARPGSQVVSMAMPFVSTITLNFKDQKINAKEVLEVLTANISYNDSITIEANGKDEKEAVEALAEYIETEE